MEAYRGLAILATNMKERARPGVPPPPALRPSLPVPGRLERREIWERAFPPETPVDGLDFDRLARLHLTGGSIHTIALNAAFLAAQARTAVTMPLVLGAARTELRKLDRPVNEADFTWIPAAPSEPEAAAATVVGPRAVAER